MGAIQIRMGAIHMRTIRSGRLRAGRMWLGTVPDDPAKPALNETTRIFGERVRDRRQELGLSQEAAAVRCGIHWTQLGKVRTRTAEPAARDDREDRPRAGN